MEVGVDLDEETVEELRVEARRQGFDGIEGYLRWIVAHRPASELTGSQAPAVASRVSDLDQRLTVLERYVNVERGEDGTLDVPGDADGAFGSTAAETEDPAEPVTDASEGEDTDTDDEVISDEEGEEGADDEDIAAAVDEVPLDNED